MKGEFILHDLPEVNMNNNPIDYMHCVLLGVVGMMHCSLTLKPQGAMCILDALHLYNYTMKLLIGTFHVRFLMQNEGFMRLNDVVTRSLRGQGWKGTVPPYYCIKPCWLAV